MHAVPFQSTRLPTNQQIENPVNARIVLLPGDGIGPEVVAEARRVLEKVATRFGHNFEFSTHPIGGNAIDDFGDPLPQQTLDACKASDAVLLGAVGGPKWDDPNAKTRPEAGLLRIRKELKLFANLRPITALDCLVDSSPLKREIVQGTDILFVRELTGGIYFGESGLTKNEDGSETAFSTMTYSTHEIERVVRLAAQAARGRKGRLTSVDKANVLEVSRLWRRVAERVVREEFPDIKYDVVLIDAMAMHLISRPNTFDVVVTGNLFGDILTDEGSMLPGSMGLLPSASIGGDGPGLYEPIHGSAPDIAGQGIANPLATILASAMLLRHSLKLEQEAAAVEQAVQRVLDAGYRTRDIASPGTQILSTTEMGQKVLAELG
jgi:3-isopropylmalate dehydrogenase